MAVIVGSLAGDESETLPGLVRRRGRRGVVVRLVPVVVRQVLVDQRVRHRPTRKGERGHEQDPGRSAQGRGHHGRQDTPSGCWRIRRLQAHLQASVVGDALVGWYPGPSRSHALCQTLNVRTRLAYLGALLLLGGALVYGTLQEAEVECEVCLEFEGARACRTAIASARDGAVGAAIRGACAVLTSGVTRGMACDRTPPSSVRCEE
jgi:hypothetical protein